MKNKYYFTFGCGMGLAKYYVIITAYTESGAREEMYRLFGSMWCTSYSEERWQEPADGTQADKWGYTLLKEYDAGDYPPEV